MKNLSSVMSSCVLSLGFASPPPYMAKTFLIIRLSVHLRLTQNALPNDILYLINIGMDFVFEDFFFSFLR